MAVAGTDTPINGRPSEKTPELQQGKGVVTATLLAPIVTVMEQEDRVPMGGRASLMGVTLWLSAGRPGRHMRPYCCDRTCVSRMICRLCIRAIACLSMIEGMWVNFFHAYGHARIRTCGHAHTYAIS